VGVPWTLHACHPDAVACASLSRHVGLRHFAQRTRRLSPAKSVVSMAEQGVPLPVAPAILPDEGAAASQADAPAGNSQQVLKKRKPRCARDRKKELEKAKKDRAEKKVQAKAFPVRLTHS